LRQQIQQALFFFLVEPFWAGRVKRRLQGEMIGLCRPNAAGDRVLPQHLATQENRANAQAAQLDRGRDEGRLPKRFFQLFTRRVWFCKSFHDAGKTYRNARYALDNSCVFSFQTVAYRLLSKPPRQTRFGIH